MIKNLIRICFGFAVIWISFHANAASSYLLEIACKREPSVTFNRSFWANDDLDAQNKARAILGSPEFQSKGDCGIKSLKRG